MLIDGRERIFMYIKDFIVFFRRKIKFSYRIYVVIGRGERRG